MKARFGVSCQNVRFWVKTMGSRAIIYGIGWDGIMVKHVSLQDARDFYAEATIKGFVMPTMWNRQFLQQKLNETRKERRHKAEEARERAAWKAGRAEREAAQERARKAEQRKKRMVVEFSGGFDEVPVHYDLMKLPYDDYEGTYAED